MAQSKDLVAVPDPNFLLDEAALKRQVVLFNRIASPPLGMLSNNTFEDPQFIKTRAWLAEQGILFEPEMKRSSTASERDVARKNFNSIRGDVNALLKPSGVSLKEFEAARGNEEKTAEIRERTAHPDYESGFSSVDPLRFFESIQRTTTNMTRIRAMELRNVEHLDAHAIISSDFSSLDQDDDRSTQHDGLATHEVVKVTLALPVPDEQVSWEQIIENRTDPDLQNQFLMLKNCVSEIARGSLALSQVEETLEYLLNRYRRELELHDMTLNTTRLEVFVVSTKDVLGALAGFRWGKATRELFSPEPRKLALLEGESTSPGSEVAYVMVATVSL